MTPAVPCEVIGCFEQARWKLTARLPAPDLEVNLCLHHFARLCQQRPQAALQFHPLEEATPQQSDPRSTAC